MTQSKIDIQPSAVQEHASAGLKVEEIAALLGCSQSIIHQQFGEDYERGRAVYLAEIRRLQLETAKSKNASMLIWLGKNELGQSDRPAPKGMPEPDVDPEMG